MRIKLYQCLCENNRMNKTPFMINEIILDGNAKNPINKSTPVIYIEDVPIEYLVIDDDNNDVVYGDNIEIGFSITGQVFNYMYIEDWDRYYFINPITFNNNRIYTIIGTLDTLMSFKNKEWTRNPLYITRRTNGNPFIYDNMLQYKYYKRKYVTFPDVNKDGYTFDFSSSTDSCLRKYCFVVAVADWKFDDANESPEKDGNLVALPSATKNATNSHLSTSYYVVTGAHLSCIFSFFYNNSDKIGVIKNVMYLPYEIERGKDMGTILYFDGGLIDFTRYSIQAETYHVYKTKYFNFDRWKYCSFIIGKASSFRDYEPHTQAFLYLPFTEKIEIELQKYRDPEQQRTYDVYYYVDYETGNSSYLIIRENYIIKTGTCQIGFKFNLTSSNLSDNQRAHENNVTAITLGSIASGVNSVSPSGINPLKLASGIINNVSQYIQRENSLVLKGQASPSSANTGALMYTTSPIMEYYKDELTFKGDDDELSQGYLHYKNNIGLPFNDYEYIYNISDGEHVIVGDTSDIIMSSDVTSQELENFKNALASGFYK